MEDFSSYSHRVHVSTDLVIIPLGAPNTLLGSVSPNRVFVGVPLSNVTTEASCLLNVSNDLDVNKLILNKQ